MSALAKITMPALADDGDLPGLGGLRLRIFDHIEPGFGIVPIVGDDAGSHMLKNGEVAVYDEDWRDRRPAEDFEPGLYCIEHQRLQGGMMPETWHRFTHDRQHPHMPRLRIERNVVIVTRDPRNKECWGYRDLRSRLHRGVRLPARYEGPIYDWAIRDLMLGPIVGLYRPNLSAAGVNS
jgi:hypothetical protein